MAALARYYKKEEIEELERGWRKAVWKMRIEKALKDGLTMEQALERVGSSPEELKEPVMPLLLSAVYGV